MINAKINTVQCVTTCMTVSLILSNGIHYPMLAQVVYIAHTPLGKKWRLCTW